MAYLVSGNVASASTWCRQTSRSCVAVRISWCAYFFYCQTARRTADGIVAVWRRQLFSARSGDKGNCVCTCLCLGDFWLHNVCPSVRMEQCRLQLGGFSWNLIFWYFWKIPYILESSPHPFYSFRGIKNQMRIRIACGLDSRSRAGFWKNDRAAVRAVRTIQ